MEFTGERFIPQREGWLALQHYHRYYFVVNQIDLNKKIILDLACGEGYGSNILSKLSKFVYGVDISHESIEHAKKSYTNQNLKFLVGNAASIPLENSTVDIVVSFETIEHHDKHQKMMQEIKRVLKDEGILIMSSPDKGFYERHFKGLKNEYHVKELYREEFGSLIDEYFLQCKFFIQNNIVGSLIASEDEDCNYERPIYIEKASGLSEKIAPRYNICIASDSEISFSSSLSICTYSIYNDFFSIIDKQKNILDKVYKSRVWKMKHFINKLFRNTIRIFIK